MNKIVLSAQDLLEDSFRLGLRVLEDGFRPTMIIAIWRGGTPVGMAVQEVLHYCGVESDHIAIRTSSYVGVDQRGAVAVHSLKDLPTEPIAGLRVWAHPERFDPRDAWLAKDGLGYGALPDDEADLERLDRIDVAGHGHDRIGRAFR